MLPFPVRRPLPTATPTVKGHQYIANQILNALK